MRPFVLITTVFILAACRQRQQYTVVLNNVEGLEKGNPVTYNGLAVGTVTRMDFYRDSIAVDMELEKDFQLRAGARCGSKHRYWAQEN